LNWYSQQPIYFHWHSCFLKSLRLVAESMKYIVESKLHCSFEKCTPLQDSSRIGLQISIWVFPIGFHISFKSLKKAADESGCYLSFIGCLETKNLHWYLDLNSNLGSHQILRDLWSWLDPQLHSLSLCHFQVLLSFRRFHQEYTCYFIFNLLALFFSCFLLIDYNFEDLHIDLKYHLKSFL
jgi:hypothetical protein